MTEMQTFDIPGLATVSIDSTQPQQPQLIVDLDTAYNGDLTDLMTNGNRTFTCTRKSLKKDPSLGRFMEVLTHWDYTGDGQPDCDHIMAAIDAAFSTDQERTKPFRRPSEGLYPKLLMTFMPPQPSRHIRFDFGKLQPRFRWYHYAAAVPMLALFFGLMTLQTHYVHWLSYSVLSGTGALLRAIGINRWLASIIVFTGIYLYLFKRRKVNNTDLNPTYGFLNGAAVYEEQAFREGSEDWSFEERVRSCFVFGALHMVNLFYPLSTILPLSLGGGLFMFYYLRTYRRTLSRRAAVLDSSIWHRVYNRVAIASFVLFISFTVVSSYPWICLIVAGSVAALWLAYKLCHEQIEATGDWLYYRLTPTGRRWRRLLLDRKSLS